jgi:hypothetical protein
MELDIEKHNDPVLRFLNFHVLHVLLEQILFNDSVVEISIFKNNTRS